MRESLTEYCTRYDRAELLSEWHPEKNGALTPQDISYGSRKKVWWRCEHGHEWQSPLYSRVGANSGCPYCTGKKVAPGLDLQSLFPKLAAQWHPVKNGETTADQVLPGSHKTVWWRCAHGHEWKAMIKSRVDGNGCPVCANKVVIPGENDLESCAPLLAMQWHPEKNGALRPDQFSCGSGRKVWWRCEHGHEWQAAINARMDGKNCPVCSGRIVVPGENDLASFYPELARQWHPEKNGSLQPSGVSVYSNKRAWWRCALGHEWQAVVSSRTVNRTDCPYCTGRKVLAGFNDLQTVQPRVAAQWHPTMNLPLEPTMVTAGCKKKVWWQCDDGHEWKAVIYSRTGARKCGCPVCAGRTARRI